MDAREIAIRYSNVLPSSGLLVYWRPQYTYEPLLDDNDDPLLDDFGNVIYDYSDPVLGWVDTIGLSISEFYTACPVAHRSIYSLNGSAFYSVATVIANIEDSVELNDGGELVGTATKGYAQYIDGAISDVLMRAYRYFGIAYP